MVATRVEPGREPRVAGDLGPRRPGRDGLGDRVGAEMAPPVDVLAEPAAELGPDGGASGISKDLTTWFNMVIDAHFVSPTEGIVAGMGKVGARCTILRTTDGGDTFDPVFTSATGGSLCWKLSFPSPLVGYVAVQVTAGGPGTFGKTTDGGLTWQELPLPMTSKPKSAYSAIGVGFVTDDIGWMAAEEADLPVFRTFNGGMTWEEDPALTSPINRFRFIDKNTAYAVGADAWKLEVVWDGN